MVFDIFHKEPFFVDGPKTIHIEATYFYHLLIYLTISQVFLKNIIWSSIVILSDLVNTFPILRLNECFGEF